MGAKTRMTWQLWRILQHPPRQHPLFWRTLQQPNSLLTPMGTTLARILFVMGGLLIVFVSPPLALILLIYGIVLLPITMLIFSGVIYGGYIALTIATHLAGEHRQGRYDLLQVTPSGATLVDMVVSAGCLHRGNRFQQMHKLVRLTAWSLLIGLGIITIFVFLSLTFNPSGSESNQAMVEQFFPMILFFLGSCAVFYFDHVQSIITGCLVGMLTPYYTQSALEVRMTSLVLFFFFQVCAYLLSLITLLITTPWIQTMIENAPLMHIVTMFWAVSIFYAVRESIIWLIWRLLLQQSDTSLAEWRAALC